MGLVPLPGLADETAKEAFERGVAHYDAGKLDEAVAAFQRAHEIDPKPIYLFSWAQSEIGRDRCAEAIDLFHRYLATNPPEANREAAEQRIRTCEERLAAAEPAPDPTQAVPDETAQPTAIPAPMTAPAASAPKGSASSKTAPPAVASSPLLARTAPRTTGDGVEPDGAFRWYHDPLGLTLLVGGFVATGVGTGVLVWGEKTLAKAHDQSFETYDSHDQALAAGRQRRIAGGVVLGVGLALVTGGILRSALVDPGSPEAPPAAADSTPVALGLSPFPPTLGAAGRF